MGMAELLVWRNMEVQMLLHFVSEMLVSAVRQIRVGKVLRFAMELQQGFLVVSNSGNGARNCPSGRNLES